MPGLTAALAEEPANREYQVKAAMLFNFAQFVEWPKEAFATANSPLQIGVAGPNPFGGVLEQLVAGKTVAGHPITVKYYSSIEGMEQSHILFIPSGQDAELKRIMQKIADKPVLSVGETDSFPWAGGIVRFYTEENKMRFEINPEAADQARLKISSKLMKLAKVFKK